MKTGDIVKNIPKSEECVLHYIDNEKGLDYLITEKNNGVGKVCALYKKSEENLVFLGTKNSPTKFKEIPTP